MENQENKTQAIRPGDEKMDLTKYPEGPLEIIKYLDFLPDNDEERMGYLLGCYMPDVVVQ